jgi:hypothetical protein
LIPHQPQRTQSIILRPLEALCKSTSVFSLFKFINNVSGSLMRQSTTAMLLSATPTLAGTTK